MTNYRTYADSVLTYRVMLRDREIEAVGMLVEASLPSEVENTVDIYGNFQRTEGSRITRSFYVVPLFEPYFQLLDIVGTDSEQSLPLEVRVKVADHIPMSTVLSIPTRRTNGSIVETKWVVNAVDIKMLNAAFAKIAKCTPYREVM
jgi:hypothetical protein